ncbi:cytochrome c oxidase subunit II [Baaleninema simplex]|uniref:cytochrome c oxidase subunit II n=1 Tax=Baaleninema simplex TaxID=2862350 RepID=UPI00034AB034|nr:cytochrome c oxidase subunit II [Baaleninema simplex]
MKLPTSINTLIAGILITLISLWYGQNHGWMPLAASEEAPLVDGLFNTMMTIATGLFLLIQGAIVISIIRFRQKPGDNTDGPAIEGNIGLEIVWTAIPVVIVLVLSVYSFEVYNEMGGLDPAASRDPGPQKTAVAPGSAMAATLPEGDGEQLALGVGASPATQGRNAELAVDVLGLQYAWIFTYPDSGVVSGELHVPAGREVQLNIAAQDVIHAFWVPQFRLKQDAIPGRQTELRFKPEVAGTYPLICAELCGAYHGAMRSQVVVHPPEEFEAWLQSQIAQQAEETPTVAAALPSESDRLQARTADWNVTSDTLASLHAHHSF